MAENAAKSIHKGASFCPFGISRDGVIAVRPVGHVIAIRAKERIERDFDRMKKDIAE